jgi:hypothetical protein
VTRKNSFQKTADLERGNRDAYFRSTKPPGPLPFEAFAGHVVGYARYSLRAMGLGPTDPLWTRRGHVVRAHETVATWVYIRWDDDPEPEVASTSALAVVGPNTRWCD